MGGFGRVACESFLVREACPGLAVLVAGVLIQAVNTGETQASSGSRVLRFTLPALRASVLNESGAAHRDISLSLSG